MNKTYLFGCMGILMMAATMSSCSNDDDPTPVRTQPTHGPLTVV